MSRIGKKPVPLPKGVQAKPSPQSLRLQGPKGALEVPIPPPIEVFLEEGRIEVKNPRPQERSARAAHGLVRALVAKGVQGVSEGFERKLEVVGTGWGARMQGRDLVLTVGFAQPVVVRTPEGVQAETPAANQIVVRGADLHLVSQAAATLRAVRPPEPYNGKGIRYVGEVVRRKAGKAFAAGR
jgi:large subunit ribosomal protein L6